MTHVVCSLTLPDRKPTADRNVMSPTNLDGIIFRAAEKQDVPAMIEVGRKAFLFAFWELSPIEVKRDWVAEDFEGRRYPELWPTARIAVVADRPIGLIGASEDHVDGLWIHPHYHRRGIGTRLMRDAETEACGLGHARMWLECSQYNADAPAFYRAIGYREAGERVEMLSTGIKERLTVFEKVLSVR